MNKYFNVMKKILMDCKQSLTEVMEDENIPALPHHGPDFDPYKIKDLKTLHSIAEDPQTHKNTLIRMRGIDDDLFPTPGAKDELHAKLANNPNMPIPQLAYMSGKYDISNNPRFVLDLLEDPAFSQKIPTEYANKFIDAPRGYVSNFLLKSLGNHPDQNVRSNLYQHHDFDPDTIHNFAMNENNLRNLDHLISKDNIKPETLSGLLDKYHTIEQNSSNGYFNKIVPQKIAQHPNISDEDFNRLLHGPDATLFDHLIKNPTLETNEHRFNSILSKLQPSRATIIMQQPYMDTNKTNKLFDALHNKIQSNIKFNSRDPLSPGLSKNLAKDFKSSLDEVYRIADDYEHLDPEGKSKYFKIRDLINKNTGNR